MINWPDMLRHAEDWANGFLAGATTVSLIGVAGAAFVLLGGSGHSGVGAPIPS